MQANSPVFGRGIHLFTIFGFSVRLDPSWFIVAVLATSNLATQAFPTQNPGLSRSTYWWMGVAGALLLFASVVVHELAHSLVARRYGVPMRGITLFLFGGVAEMSAEVPSPKAEFWIAIAGPAMSLAIALAGFGLSFAGEGMGLPEPVLGVVTYLAMINAMLVAFNMVPAFPLDGGRVLRSILWHFKGSLRRATRISSQIGSGFGFLLIALGVWFVIQGNWSGIWFFLLGLFLRNAAQMSYQQLLLRRAFEGEPVARFMQTNPVTVPRQISVAELVQDYIYRHHYKMYPVLDDSGRLLGCVTARQVKELPREEWESTTVGALAKHCNPENVVRPDTDAMEALSAMSRNGISRLMVAEGDQLLGILTLKDLLRFFSLKMELEQT
ncbi:MAG TPA: site-2 protease family protein [Thermoanaerobaculia bacterium]|nr:site-2 protease family protein [Thermoanaerobaculia bacterium]